MELIFLLFLILMVASIICVIQMLVGMFLKLQPIVKKTIMTTALTDLLIRQMNRCLLLVCKFEPVDMPGELVFAPSRKRLEADISVPRAVFHSPTGYDYSVKLIHFSNYRTQLSFYRNEVVKLDRLIGRGDKTLHKMPNWMRITLLRISDVAPLCKRVINKVKRVLNS